MGMAEVGAEGAEPGVVSRYIREVEVVAGARPREERTGRVFEVKGRTGNFSKVTGDEPGW